MYHDPQSARDREIQALRRDAGRWLRRLREEAGLSQREVARRLGIGRHSFISRLEAGRGRVPPDRYLPWAASLGVDPIDFVRELLRFYDPYAHTILFAETDLGGEPSRLAAEAAAWRPVAH
jgi:transcriptional regulator with XRE-family HTH domain